MSTRNKAFYLDRTLSSIRRQDVPFAYEVIVSDDGSTDETRDVCRKYEVHHIFLENDTYRNPSIARNAGYRVAHGDVVIAQSDDVVHQSANTIKHLTEQLRVGEFLLANVQNWEYSVEGPTVFVKDFCSRALQHPYFFLGSLWRSDLFKIGGNCEEFVEPCWDDDWFAECLIRGLGLTPIYTDTVEGRHQHHGYPSGTHRREIISKTLYESKMRVAEETGIYEGTDAPWEYDCD